MEPGSIGTYELVRLIARGGMATVYEARQPALGRAVALKRLDLRTDDPTLVDRFIHESRIGASFDHPNVVTVIDFFEHDGVPCIAMEYLPRGSLRPWVSRLSLPQVFGVLEDVLAALAHAEEHGVAHRDLKPENVLITGRGAVKIADFGIAKAYTRLTNRFTTAGVAVGTPAYMAPEQALAQSVGAYTDLYAVGVMAFEMLSGAPPFGEGETPVATMYRHVSEPPPPLEGVDPRLAAWVSRLLEKVPEDRPQGAAEAWDALEEVVVDLLGPYWRRDAPLIERGAPPSGNGTVRRDFITFDRRIIAPAHEVIPRAYEVVQGGAPRDEAVVHEVLPRAEDVVAPAPAPGAADEPVADTAVPDESWAEPSVVDEPAAGEPRAARRRRPVAVVAAVLVAAGAAVAVVLALTGPGGEPPFEPPPPPPPPPEPPRAAAPFDFAGDGRAAVVAGLPGAGVVELPGSGRVIAPRRDAAEFGAAVASADFDRDGRADLAVGAPGANEVTVLYGAARARSATFGGPERFGAALAAGDLDGDGHADLAVGAPGGAGSIRLLFGGPGGLTRRAARTIDPPDERFAGFGGVLALGDVDGDGRVDLVEGGPGDHATFCRGRARGPVRCRRLGVAGPASLAVGDVTGDRFPDIVQGHPALGTAGTVLIWPGSGAGPAEQPIAVTQETPGVRGNDQFGDAFGSSVLVADIDGDRFEDMVVAAPGEDEGAGRVTLVRGGRDGRVAGGRGYSQATPGVPGDQAPGRAFGAAITLLDSDADGRLDLTVAMAGAVVTLPGAERQFSANESSAEELRRAIDPRIALGLPN